MGHLTEQDALDIAQSAESVMNCKTIDKNEIIQARIVQIPDKTIYDYDVP